MAFALHQRFHGLMIPGASSPSAKLPAYAAADIVRPLERIITSIRNRRTAEPHVGNGTTVIAWLAVGAIIGHAILADWSAMYLKNRSKTRGKDESSWLMGEAELAHGRLPRHQLAARAMSIAGSVAVLLAFTVLWWATGEKAGLAICAVGLTVRFTYVPVSFTCTRFPGGKISFNMASMPWCIICWLLIFNAIPLSTIATGLLGSSEDVLPWTMIVVLFGSIYLCMTLEATGGLDAIASWYVGAVGRSSSTVFLSLALVTAVLTILIPNDVVLLVLTPAVCVLSKENRLDPIPLLYVVFYNAHTWPVILVVGNVTNTLVAISMKIKFLAYARIMLWPGVVAGAVSLLLLRIAFWGPARRPLRRWEKTYGAAQDDEHPEPAPPVSGADMSPDDEAGGTGARKPVLRTRMRLCLIRFVAVFVFASFDSMHEWPIWLSIAVFTVGSFVMDVILDVAKVDGTGNFTLGVLGNLPYDLLFFFFALFVLVAMLVQTGLVTSIAGHLDPLAAHPYKMMVAVGYIHLLLSQVTSSIPTSILILEVIARVPSFQGREGDLDRAAFLAENACLWALVLSSNFGGNVSRMGAIGGQIWVKIAARHGIVLHDVPILLRGCLIMIPTTLVSMTVLYFTIEADLQSIGPGGA